MCRPVAYSEVPTAACALVGAAARAARMVRGSSREKRIPGGSRRCAGRATADHAHLIGGSVHTRLRGRGAANPRTCRALRELPMPRCTGRAEKLRAGSATASVSFERELLLERLQCLVG